MIDRFERFSLAIFEISYCWHKLAAEEMAKYGLKGPHAIYLLMLRRSEQSLTAAQLCELCGRDKADVSRAIAVLEQKGYIYKEAGRYRAKLYLTEQGKQMAQYVRDIAQRAVTVAGGDISDEDRAVLYGALESIAGKLQELSIDSLPEGRNEREMV